MDMKSKFGSILIAPLILAVVFVSVMPGARAQASEAKVYLGTNQTTFAGKATNENYNAQWGLTVGASALIGERNGWVFAPGAAYVQRNSSFSNTYNNVPYSGNVKLQYLDIPLYAMYRFNDFANIYAGPVVALNLSASCDAPGCGTVNSAVMMASIGAGVKVIEDLGIDVYIKKAFGDSFSNSTTGGGGTNVLDVGIALTYYIY